VEAGVRQYVILGAGLDTFAYRNPFSALRVFEVDHPETQAWTRRRVTAAGLQTDDRVGRGNQPWSAALHEAVEKNTTAMTTREARIKAMTLTTTPGIFQDLFANIRDIVGGRSAAYEQELARARTIALDELKNAAQQLGADAVVGIDLDYEVLGSHNGMLMVSVSGTAVTLG
jgi:uncharacterized protein YbjQ (UPF0145 family)